jgi:hypothetical protein
MSLTLRSAKGSPLTHAEVDANWGWCSPTSGSTQQNLDLKGSLDAPNTWTKGQRGAFVALTSSSASIAVDLNLSNNFYHETTEDTELPIPTNAVAGQSGIIEFIQGATPRSLTFATFWKFPGSVVPTLTQTTGYRDVLSYTINYAGTSATCVMLNDVRNGALNG